MGEAGVRRGRRALRRRLRRQRRGLVSVVGTLLALLVFLSLFGTFLVFYLPLWMTDDESAFTANLQASLANLQSNMQLQTLEGSSASLAQPFTMTSQSVPLLAVPTSATLSFLPDTAGASVSLKVPNFFGSGLTYSQSLSLGTLTLVVPNRYYTASTFEYEDGAVIQSVSDTNQYVVYPPIFSIEKLGQNTTLTVALTQMYGNATRLVSPGTIQVYSQLLGTVQTLTSQYSTGTLAPVLTLQTHYACAWTNFFLQERRSGNISASQMTVTSTDTSGCKTVNGDSETVTVGFTAINSLTVIVSNFQLSAGIGVT